jgi:hypothetical protein
LNSNLALLYNILLEVDGGKHFHGVTDQELAAEQLSRNHLLMRKIVKDSSLHCLVISIQKRNTNN